MKKVYSVNVHHAAEAPKVAHVSHNVEKNIFFAKIDNRIASRANNIKTLVKRLCDKGVSSIWYTDTEIKTDLKTAVKEVRMELKTH